VRVPRRGQPDLAERACAGLRGGGLGTYKTTAERVAVAIGPGTRAIMIAHALGNPYPAAEIAALAAEHDLFFIEDNCDAAGSALPGQARLTGTFGHLTDHELRSRPPPDHG
jgi:hypothetical protein